MPRTHARIGVNIWQDEDFLALPPYAQWAYMLVLSQPDLNLAGVIWYRPKRWSNLAAGATVESVERGIDKLHETRFVVVDRDSEELLVRTFIRNDEVWKQPNVFLSALRTIPGTLSRTLRGTLREELQRLPLDNLTGPKGPIVRAEVNRLIAELPSHPPTDPPGAASPQVNGSRPEISTSETEGITEGFAEGMRLGSGERGVVTVVRKGIPHTPNSVPLPPSAGGASASRATPVAAELAPTDGALALVPDTQPAIAAHDNAQTLIAGWLRLCPQHPHSSVVGAVRNQIVSMLNEGIPAAVIEPGLAAWQSKGLRPALIPEVVHETAQLGASSAHAPPSAATTKATGWLSLAPSAAAHREHTDRRALPGGQP